MIDLPLDIRVYIGRLEPEIFIRLYMYDIEFRKYANKNVCMQITTVKKYYSVEYNVGNITCCKCDNGSEFWSKNGILHRLDGPAVVYSSGAKLYYINGKPHRLNGPAIILSDGSIEYWINGWKIDK